MQQRLQSQFFGFKNKIIKLFSPLKLVDCDSFSWKFKVDFFFPPGLPACSIISKVKVFSEIAAGNYKENRQG